MSFQPFVVHCQTCGSQLRVADPAIVGTIAPCPKCSSLVQIDRPDHQVAVGGSSVDSQAITEEAISSQEGAALGTAPSTASGFAEKTGDAASEAEAMGGAPMPPPWQSERTQRSRQIGLVVAVSLSSLLVAIAGFSWFVQSWRKNESGTEIAQSPSTEMEAVPSVEPESENGEIESGVANPDPTLEGDTESSVTDDASSESTPEETPPTEDENNTEEKSEPLAGSTEPLEQADADSANEPTPPPAQPPTLSGIDDLIPRSPIDPPPPKVPGAQPQTAGAQTQESPSTGSGMQELPPALAAYTKFLIEDGATEQPTLDAPPTMDEVNIEAATDIMDDPTITVRPKVVNLKADLAIRMALDTEGYPLPKLGLIISPISGVPIQIDWVSFDMAGTDLDAPVATLQGWQSAREILDAAAFKLGAEVREESSLVLITLTDETFDQTLGSITNLSDFGDGEASAKQVLIDFLRGEGEEAGKEPNLGDTREDRILAVIAADVLRRMRGITPKVDDSHMHRWAWSSNDPTGEWAPLTGGQPGPQYDTPISVSGFLRRMATLNGVTNLVNWYDFGSRNVAPERLSIPHAEDDAAQTIDRVFRPLGLQVREVDAKHWWVGRESTYDRLPAVIWTPPLAENRDRFIQDLAKIMSGASREAFRMTIDPQSDRAMLLLPRYIVRQLEKVAGGAAAATNE